MKTFAASPDVQAPLASLDEWVLIAQGVVLVLVVMLGGGW